MPRRRILVLSVVVLAVLLLACEEGYSENGTMTRTKYVNQKGTLTRTMRKANGHTEKSFELTEHFGSGTDVFVNATLEVEDGFFEIEFMDYETIVLTLTAHGGESDSGQATVSTNGFGELGVRITASDAQRVKLVIEFEER